MPRGHYLTEAVKDAIWEVRAEGLSEAEIGRAPPGPRRVQPCRGFSCLRRSSDASTREGCRRDFGGLSCSVAVRRATRVAACDLGLGRRDSLRFRLGLDPLTA
jgi:hypothetical protein